MPSQARYLWRHSGDGGTASVDWFFCGASLTGKTALAVGNVVDIDEEIDTEMTVPYWLDVLTMLAIRWYSEVVAEKNCILVAAFVSKVIMKVKRPAAAHGRLTGILFVTEFIADGLLVYSLDKWFGVPFLRLPPPPSIRSRE